MVMASPFECPVCLDPFECEVPSRQPLALPCGHTFCRSCLVKVHPQRCPTESAAAQQKAVAVELQHKWDAVQQQAADVLTELQRSQHAMAQQMAAMQLEIDTKDEAAQSQAAAAQEELHMTQLRLHLRVNSPHGSNRSSSPDPADTDAARTSVPAPEHEQRTFQEVAAQVRALQLEMERRDQVTQRVARVSQVEQARVSRSLGRHRFAFYCAHTQEWAGFVIPGCARPPSSSRPAAAAEQRRTSNVLHLLASQSSLAPLVPLALVALSPPIYTPSSAAFAAQLFLRTTNLDEAAASASALSAAQATGLIHSLYDDMDEVQSSPARPLVNSIITPTTFDLGGRELHHFSPRRGIIREACLRCWRGMLARREAGWWSQASASGSGSGSGGGGGTGSGGGGPGGRSDVEIPHPAGDGGDEEGTASGSSSGSGSSGRRASLPSRATTTSGGTDGGDIDTSRSSSRSQVSQVSGGGGSGGGGSGGAPAASTSSAAA
ncbi:MAG: hypothetical protein WDW38_011137 [Sanguina aurantia]